MASEYMVGKFVLCNWNRLIEWDVIINWGRGLMGYWFIKMEKFKEKKRNNNNNKQTFKCRTINFQQSYLKL